MSRIFKGEAIVLRKRSLSNQDKIITLFSQNFGKINVYAKGIKKITSRRLPHIQTANLVKILLYKKEDRLYLQETELTSALSHLKENPHKVSAVYFFFFILERLLPENQNEEEVYRLTKKFLIDLSNVSDLTSLNLTYYINNLLKKLGYIKEEKSLEEAKVLIQEIIDEPLPTLDYE